MIMVIDQERSDCCSTDVSFIMWTRVHIHNNIYNCTGDGRNGNLSKEQFATIVEGKLVYDEGKDDQYVFGGMTIKLILVIRMHHRVYEFIKSEGLRL